jgi:hypothetical protein
MEQPSARTGGAYTKSIFLQTVHTALRLVRMFQTSLSRFTIIRLRSRLMARYPAGKVLGFYAGTDEASLRSEPSEFRPQSAGSTRCGDGRATSTPCRTRRPDMPLEPQICNALALVWALRLAVGVARRVGRRVAASVVHRRICARRPRSHRKSPAFLSICTARVWPQPVASAGTRGGAPVGDAGPRPRPRNMVCSAGTTTSSMMGPISMPPTTTVASGRCTWLPVPVEIAGG